MMKSSDGWVDDGWEDDGWEDDGWEDDGCIDVGWGAEGGGAAGRFCESVPPADASGAACATAAPKNGIPVDRNRATAKMMAIARAKPVAKAPVIRLPGFRAWPPAELCPTGGGPVKDHQVNVAIRGHVAASVTAVSHQRDLLPQPVGAAFAQVVQGGVGQP